MKRIFILLFCFALTLSTNAQEWRKMSEPELKTVVPEKAPVVKEDIETEFRTASGITNGTRNIFGVVIITAGYEADGKYTHFLRLGDKMSIGRLRLQADDYIFGYKRLDNFTLNVTFYQAKTGKRIGSVRARVEQKKGAIYSLQIEPPVNQKGRIYIGRFSLEYSFE